jgi:predicted PurR-regulated permease PerM
MDRASKAALAIIATGVVAAGFYFGRNVLTQFALAALLWLGVGGIASWLERKTKLDRRIGLILGGVLVAALAAAGVWLFVINVTAMGTQASTYEARLNDLITQAYSLAGLDAPPPTTRQLAERFSIDHMIGEAALGARGALGDATFILLYVAFIFAASRSFAAKLDAIFPQPVSRAHVRKVLTRMRRSMETYLWVQTIISLIISVATYLTLLLIGLENALFWTFLIFFLNFIPTIGSIIATILPTIFALVQFPDLVPVALVAFGVGFWQFFIGNVVQPRMMSESLNLSALVVLASLAIWGALWGIAGAFLSAPLTVMAMIALAQFPSTRWIAILLSENGDPDHGNGAAA